MKLVRLYATCVALLLICFTGVSWGWEQQLKELASLNRWEQASRIRPTITPEIIDQALEAARVYYLNAQYPEGNFRYGLNLTDNMEDEDDNQVRQAGALRGLS